MISQQLSIRIETTSGNKTLKLLGEPLPSTQTYDIFRILIYISQPHFIMNIDCCDVVKTEPIFDNNVNSQRNGFQSEYQIAFADFIQQTEQPNSNTPNFTTKTPEQRLEAHKRYLPNRFNSTDCYNRINHSKPPYIPHNFHTPVVCKDTASIELFNVLQNFTYHEVKNPMPIYMNNEAFAFCMTALKLKMNDKAFTAIDVLRIIPHEVKLMLSYGPKFALPLPITQERSQLLFDAINTLNSFQLAVYECRTLVAIAKQHIQNAEQLKSSMSNNSQLFYGHIYNCTIRFFTENTELMMAQADKGNISIIIPRSKYIDKMNAHVNDINVYNPISITNHTSLQRINDRILCKLANYKLLRQENITTILSNEQKIANLYGLIKIHKETFPTRPIVNTRAAPGYAIAKIISTIITPARDRYKYNIANSMNFLHKIKEIDMEPTDKIASLDITNMFTNISTSMALEAIKTRYASGKISNILPLETLIEAITFVTQTSTEVEFNNQLYKQKMGLRMGGALSTILSDFVIEDLLDDVFSRIKKPKLFVKYVDDCFLVSEPALIPHIIKMLNSHNEHIQFIPTFEDQNGSVTYLNMIIKNTHTYQDLMTSWHTKEISSCRLINYYSSHPRNMIENTAKCFVTEMLKLTHTSIRSTIFRRAHRILIDNDFPESVAHRITKLAGACINNPDSRNESTQAEFHDPYEIDTMTEKEKSIYIALPHIPMVTPNLNREIRAMHPDYKTSAKPINTMRHNYNAHKNLNPLPSSFSQR